jgi:hypothetical protein
VAKIAIDIDSTLYDFASLACQTMGEIAEERGDERLRNAAYSTTWTEWRTPIDLAGEEAWNEVVDRCHKPEVILAQRAYVGAREELWDLDDAGHELVYVSNRNPSTFDATDAWLAVWAFPEGKLLCHSEDKLMSIRDCQYLIDDRPKTLVGFVYDSGPWPDQDGWGGNRRAFGLVTPYNRNLTDVPGIYLAPSWPLLGRYLREKIHPAVGV